MVIIIRARIMLCPVIVPDAVDANGADSETSGPDQNGRRSHQSSLRCQAETAPGSSGKAPVAAPEGRVRFLRPQIPHP